MEHRPDVRMKHVDALSRNAVMTIVEDSIVAKVRTTQVDDSNLNAFRGALKIKPIDELTLSGGILYKFDDGRDLLVVLDSMQDKILQLINQKNYLSAKRTEDIIQKEYFIPDLKKKIDKFIVYTNCISCILANRKQDRLEGQLHPLPKSNVPLHTYHVDHLGSLESTSKKVQPHSGSNR